MILETLLYIILATSLLMVNTVHATKNVTMSLEKDEMIYCTYGSKKSPTAICDKLELTNRFDLVDKFLEYLQSGVID